VVKGESMSNILHSSKSTEWYTPGYIIESVKNVFNGKIDLDPASCEAANKIIGAKEYYDKEDNGLEKPWSGSVFCNPPYGRNVSAWVNKCLAEEELIVQNRYIITNLQMILLVNAVTDRNWFQPLWKYPICFFRKRIKFINSETMKADSRPTHGNAMVYFGIKPDRFKREFYQYGHIVMPEL
jgi:ParB family chromosome partitioning protein